MGGFELSTVFPALGGPATLIVGYLMYRFHLSQRLDDRLKALLTDDRKAALSKLDETDAQQLVIAPALAEPALSLLLQFQQVANSVTASPTLWDHALANDEHQLLRAAVERATLLIQVVRGSSWPFKTKAWNGSRRRAFTALLKAVRVKLPRNS